MPENTIEKWFYYFSPRKVEKYPGTIFTFLTWNNSKWITKLVLCYIICFLTQFLLREYLWWFNCCVKICTMHLQAPLTSECFYVSSSSIFSPLFVRLSLKAKFIAPQPVRYMKLCIIRSSGPRDFRFALWKIWSFNVTPYLFVLFIVAQFQVEGLID